VNRLNVQITDVTLGKIRDQVQFIARDSIENALAWEDRLLEAIESLGDFHGHAIDEEAGIRIGGTIHKMVFEQTYLVHYEVKDVAGIVEVVNFRHGARQPRAGEP
jgi:plasmid stabilization system protein ParE